MKFNIIVINCFTLILLIIITMASESTLEHIAVDESAINVSTMDVSTVVETETNSESKKSDVEWEQECKELEMDLTECQKKCNQLNEELNEYKLNYRKLVDQYHDINNQLDHVCKELNKYKNLNERIQESISRSCDDIKKVSGQSETIKNSSFNYTTGIGLFIAGTLLGGLGLYSFNKFA